jgi:hypothetical protein
MRINGLLAAAWQALQPLVSSSKATVNLSLLFAVTAFSSSTIRGSMMVFIISATGMPKGWMQSSGLVQAFPDLVDLVSSEVPVTFSAGKPQLGVAKLCGCHKFTKAWFVAFICRLCSCERY